jgi:hypothetical protein
MELRNWIKEQFGGKETLLDESKYSSQEIKEDKIRLRQERKRLQKELNELGAEYQKLLEQGAQANEMERKQYAQQAKIAKKKYKIKQQQYQKNSMQMATVVTIEGARELMEMSNKNTTTFEEIMDDPNVDLSHVQESLMDTMVEYELDMDMMMEIQDALDIDIIGADVDMGASEEEEIMEDIAAGEMDSGDIDLESQAEEDVEESLDEDMGMGGMDLNVGNGA